MKKCESTLKGVGVIIFFVFVTFEQIRMVVDRVKMGILVANVLGGQGT